MKLHKENNKEKRTKKYKKTKTNKPDIAKRNQKIAEFPLKKIIS